MPPTGIPGDVLQRWRLARGWTPRRMAEALCAASEEPLTPTIAELARMITKWEAGPRRPSEGYLMLYHRVFPGLGQVDPPEGKAVYGGPGQPKAPPVLPSGYARSLAAISRSLALRKEAQDLVEHAAGIRGQAGGLRAQAGALTVLASAGDVPGPDEVARIAEERIAAGADQARVRAVKETIHDLQRKAVDLTIVLASMNGEDEADGDARAG